MTGLAQ